MGHYPKETVGSTALTSISVLDGACFDDGVDSTKTRKYFHSIAVHSTATGVVPLPSLVFQYYYERANDSTRLIQ